MDYNSVEKIAVVLTGAPRAVSLDQWRERVPERFCTTQGPEIHVFVCANNYDSADRYILGEDPNLAGLDKEPYIDYDDPVKKAKATEMLDKLFHKRDWYGNTIQGRRPLNKCKWEEHHQAAWAEADSLTFVYWDSYEICKEMSENFSSPQINNATWHNQYLLYISAYHQNKEFFDSLTPNDMVYRQRYDIGLQPRFDLFVFAERLFNSDHGSSNWHDQGFQLSPKVLVPQLSVVRGKLCADDVCNAWDGPGAKLFDHEYVNYLKQKQEHWNKAPVEKRDLGVEGVSWYTPEQSLPQFSLQYNYTMYHATSRHQLGTELFSKGDGINFPSPEVDQWRYHWYDWTEEMVQEIREQCN